MSDPEPPVDWLVAASRLALIATQLANVIHEANNILQIIGGNAELIAMSDARPVVAERARAIADQTQRASELLAEVLAFSRDVSAKTDRVDVKAIVERALILRRYSLSKARIDVAVHGEGEYPVIGNRQQLLQTMLIVLMNAEQALAGTPDARIVIEFAAAPDLISVLVSDNSAGKTRVDEPAERAPVWNPKTPLRLGIGLTVAKHLIALHHGTIALRPSVPRGTTVVLTLRGWK